jgi:hypothetical protein
MKKAFLTAVLLLVVAAPVSAQEKKLDPLVVSYA